MILSLRLALEAYYYGADGIWSLGICYGVLGCRWVHDKHRGVRWSRLWVADCSMVREHSRV